MLDVEKTWEEFDKKLKVHFQTGANLIQEKLNLQLKNQGQTVQVDYRNILDSVGFNITNDFNAALKQVTQSIQQSNQPRVSIERQDLELSEENKHFKETPYGNKDGFRQRVENDVNAGKPILQSFTDQANEYRKALKMALVPGGGGKKLEDELDYRPTIKPSPLK